MACSRHYIIVRDDDYDDDDDDEMTKKFLLSDYRAFPFHIYFRYSANVLFNKLDHVTSK